jgi:hypothetical protein
MEKGKKYSSEKSYQQKSYRKINFLLFYYCMQKFSAYNFFGEFFCFFPLDSSSAYELSVFLYSYQILPKKCFGLYKQFFAISLKPNGNETAQKNLKHII